jgi:hypothetical protein
VLHAKFPERIHAVRPDSQSCSHLANGADALDDERFHPNSPEAYRRREPTDTPADNQCAHRDPV